MIDIVIFLLPVFAIFMFGIFDAAQTIRKDNPDKAIFWRHEVSFNKICGFAQLESARKSATKVYGLSRFDLWYIGGNHWYNPRSQFGFLFGLKEQISADFWHQMKNCWTWMISLCAISCIVSAWHFGPKWFLFLYLFLNAVEGITFNVFYKWVFVKARLPFCKFVKENYFKKVRY